MFYLDFVQDSTGFCSVSKALAKPRQSIGGSSAQTTLKRWSFNRQQLEKIRKLKNILPCNYSSI